MRDIAESSLRIIIYQRWKKIYYDLEDEDEGDPLIPGVADLVPIFRDRNQVWVVHPGRIEFSRTALGNRQPFKMDELSDLG